MAEELGFVIGNAGVIEIEGAVIFLVRMDGGYILGNVGDFFLELALEALEGSFAGFDQTAGKGPAIGIGDGGNVIAVEKEKLAFPGDNSASGVHGCNLMWN